jgi:glutaminyl-tRNA synthetase
VSTESTESSNFLRAQMEADLEAGRYASIVTRFPPEPNGQLHIGHAKAICVDFGLAARYGGRCHLRFDDTNPTKEDAAYVEAIQADIRWLGFDWGEHLYHASDYFQQLYDWAVKLIEEGKAYVDSSTEEEIRAMRGTVTEPGTPSPYRDRPVEESLRLFDEMRRGLHAEGSHVVRAKADMAHANMKMRDPLMYRVLNVPHDRTGDTWHVYPFYDYAHGLSDAIEGITHSICTLEFQNNRALYDFFVELVGFTEPRPHQYEMARLKLPYTVVSKRRLGPLVEDGIVAGWDDPRMSTLAGLRNRGVPPEAIRSFIERIGVAKANSVVDPLLLDNAIRDTLNVQAKRLMAVLDPLPVRITNWPGGVKELTAPLYPDDVPLEGSRALPFGGELVIERSDFMETPVKGFRRLAPGREVRLRYGYVIRCTNVLKDDAGHVVALEATYDPDSEGGNTADGRRIQGTIHWVATETGRRIEVRDYEQLFTTANLDGIKDLTPHVNPDSLVVREAWVEPAVLDEEIGARVQFERTGYYFFNPSMQGGELPVFNRIVALKSSWGAASDKVRPPPTLTPPAKQQVVGRTFTAHEQSVLDDLKARGIGADDATVLLDDEDLRARVDAIVAAGASPAGAARWSIHELAKRDGSVAPDALAELIQLVEDGTITHRIGRDVLEVLATEGGRPEAIVDARGWRPISGEDALGKLVDEVLAAHPDEAAAWRDGKDRLQGFFVGRVMKASQGRADARKVQELLAARR